MKKLFVLCLAALLLLGAVGCDRGGTDDTSDTTVAGSVLGPGATAEELVDSDLAEKIGVSSDKFVVDNAMVAFFLYDIFNQFVSENYYYLSSYGLDPNKSLKEQPFNYGDEETWFDYFLGSAKQQLAEMLALVSSAESTELQPKYREAIDSYLKSVREYAAENDYKSVDHYYASAYVSGVTEEVVSRALELSYLASQRYSEIYDGFTFTDAEYEDYVAKEPAQFYLFDYVYYSFYAEYDKDATEEDIKAAYEEAKTKANTLAEKMKTEGMSALIAQIMQDEECDKATAEKKLEDKCTAEEDYIYEPADFFRWVFDKDRKIGDIGISWDEEYEMCTVYLLQSTGERIDYQSKDVRHILFTSATYGSEDAAKAEAERVLALYEAGEKTADAFGALAKEYTEDSNGDVGGLYENVLLDTMVAEFEDWIYDAARKEGDVSIVKTQYGFHIMYFVGDGLASWQIAADEALRSEKVEEAFDELLETYKVTFHDEVLREIP